MERGACPSVRAAPGGKRQPPLLPRAAFVSLPRAARLRVYAGLFHRFGRGQAQSEKLFRLDEAAVSSRSRKVFQFPGGVCITTDGDGVLMKTGGGGKNPF